MFMPNTAGRLDVHMRMNAVHTDARPVRMNRKRSTGWCLVCDRNM
ncbi:hypothetical protein SEA_STEAMEDHAMS_60 [Gordonia phage SteamedHams]|nr:hypothetical protein SEA_STEAMEDHAMS_60 [Gordonia phage SteamedHams]QGJ96009.1 hypothetical protein PBI_YARN_56 [Gordonia phage Yarn]